MHAVIGSQNGFDNSGLANRTTWTSETEFDHNAIGEWMGEWDLNNHRYKSYNQDNIDFAKDTIQGLLNTWGDHEALYAIEPMNEPWGSSDLNVLMQFYRDVRKMIKDQKPRLKFVFHDAFHFDAGLWNQLFDDNDHENVVMDTH